MRATGSYQVVLLVLATVALLFLAACGGTARSAVSPSAVTVQLTANPTSIAPGQSTTLSWNSSNATSVTISPGGAGTLPASGTLTVSPTTTTTYTATATGASGNATANVTVTVSGAAVKPTITLTASPTTVNAGQFSTLTWATTGATSISFSPALPHEDEQPLALSGNAPVVPTQTTTYTATATGPGGTATATVTLIVNQPAPTVTLTANPTSIISGQKATLTWSTKNATTLTIDNGVGNQSAVVSGSVDVSPTTTTTYTATATGPGGSATATAIVTVQQQLAITLTANPTSIAGGQSSTLTWTSQLATSVTIDQGIGAVNLNGSRAVSPTQTTTYTATAKDAAGNTKTASATVTLLPSGTFQNSIKHIIYLVQENRSFDNYFGFLGPYKASKGFANDIDGLPADAVQLDRNGAAVHPYHYQTVCVENTSPSWNPSWFSYNNGNMDHFVSVTELPSNIDPNYHRAMGYYNQDDLPYYYELATQFATSDRFFESVMAGTIPNRMYLFTGTSFGHIFPDPPPSGGFRQKTLFRLLNEHNVNWRYYYQDNSIFLGQFSDWNDPAIQGRVFNLDDWYNILANPKADDLLPSVIFIEHAAGTDIPTAFDEHPGTNTTQGVARVKQILDALMKSDAWKSSVFIITYDEYGGLYDHVPIQAAPAPDDIQPIASPGFETPLPGDFAHTGFRIPIIVVSPWVKPHFNSKTVRETTSILKLIEFRFGLPSLTARDAWADNMTEFFDFTKPAWLTPPPLPAQPTGQLCDFNAELNGQH